jgi:hypothetical protein
MKVAGIDYGLETPWEIEVPDSAFVLERPRAGSDPTSASRRSRGHQRSDSESNRDAASS